MLGELKNSQDSVILHYYILKFIYFIFNIIRLIYLNLKILDWRMRSIELNKNISKREKNKIN
jgi:hypothetical protein